jgi:hypothetical protein
MNAEKFYRQQTTHDPGWRLSRWILTIDSESEV